MRKHLLLLLSSLMTLSLVAQETKTAQEVIHNFAPNANVVLKLDKKNNDKKYFEVEVRNNKVYIAASSGSALCRGFYDFVRKNNYGINSWSGNRAELPQKLADAKRYKVVSPVENHFYFNVVTYGYTMPYWDWTRWNKEIDFMALHGIDMPLALVANEAITQRVWRKLGLTDQEIGNYFTGPAHLPWMRMGNMSVKDGPLTQSWHEDQIGLQHKILAKMRALGMKPICPAFAGFVPKEMKRLYPDVEIVETHWPGPDGFNNWMVSPKSELFSKIGTMFIEEWEAEFGKCGYYLADSFNEMEIPFPPVGTDERYNLLADYGEILYNSIHSANPEAVWVMQGWMLGFQRDIWEPKSLEALCSKVPDDKMLILDEAVDYNRNFWKNENNWDFFNGFFGKQWAYGSIPNMGGKSGMTGVLEFYANGHLSALNSSNKGHLTGIGMAPEGIENNEVIYELITDAAWRTDSISLKKWLHNYSLSRYGRVTTTIDSTWNYLLKSVYGTFTDHPRYNWQFSAGRVRSGSINTNDDFYKAIELFLSEPISQSELYKVDAIEMTAAYLGGKAELLTHLFENALLVGDRDKARDVADRFISILTSMDRLLESHPTHNLKYWINYARAYGKDSKQSDYYEMNAKRLITIWGPPIDDYSARIWGGLIRDYYIPRWQKYFEIRLAGETFDPQDMAKWEVDWVENKKGLSECIAYENIITSASELIQDAKNISTSVVASEIGSWNNPKSDKPLQFSVSPAKLKSSAAFLFNYMRGNGGLDISKIVIEMDGKLIDVVIPRDFKVDASNRRFILPVSIPKMMQGNNSCTVTIIASGNTIGKIEMIPEL